MDEVTGRKGWLQTVADADRFIISVLSTEEYNNMKINMNLYFCSWLMSWVFDFPFRQAHLLYTWKAAWESSTAYVKKKVV